MRDMTKLERRCVDKVYGEYGRPFGGRYTALNIVRAVLAEAGVAEMVAALVEVRQWIDGWTPDFVQDDEWPETAARVDAAIAKARA